MSNNTISSLMQKAEERCKNIGISYAFIPLPEDLAPNVTSHVKFHGITLKEAIPTLIFKTENAFIAVQKRADTKIDSTKLKKLAGVKSMNFATPDDLAKLGTVVGVVPLTGLSIPHYIDEKVLESDTIYGGSGSKLFALKLNSADLQKLNNAVIGEFTYLI